MSSPLFSRKSLPLSLTAIGVVIGLNVIAPANSTALERLLALMIILVSFFPAVRFMSREEGGLPFLSLFGWVYAIHYAFPVFLLDSFGFREWIFSHANVEKSLLLSLVGLILLFLAFYRFPFPEKTPLLLKINLTWDIEKAKRVAPFFGFVGLTVSYMINTREAPEVLEQVLLFISCLSLLGICMLFILQLQGRLALPSKLLLWGVLIPLQIGIDLSTGAVYQVMKDIVPLLYIFWSLKRKIPWGAIFVGIILLILLRGNQQEFRALTNDPLYAGSPVPEKSRLYIQLVVNNTRDRGVGDAYASTLERVSHLVTLTDVVEQTPSVVPYWGGETYLSLMTSLIPRVVWPDKPTKELGQTFGHRYGRLHPEDTITSDNLPQLVEMYANFGLWGVLIGMFLTGLIYRYLYVMINHPQAGEGCLAISAIIFTHMLSIESDFSLVFGAVIQYLLLLYIILKTLRAKDTVRATA